MQLQNAESPIELTDVGITTSIRDVQSIKDSSPILVIDVGIETDVNEAHFINDFALICWT